jgi:hypothetical protein
MASLKRLSFLLIVFSSLLLQLQFLFRILSPDKDIYFQNFGLIHSTFETVDVKLRLPRKANQHKLCILIPFRDSCAKHSRSHIGERSRHLQKFLQYMQDFLESVGQTGFEFVVINQTASGLFNKGVLFNVGADVAHWRGCDYIAMHDVDHLPLHKGNRYAWPDRPIHLCTNSSDVGIGPFAGGVVLMQLRHYAAIRGMSNHYNGWGAEDNDLYERIKRIYGSIDRLDPMLGVYEPLPHGRNETGQVHDTGESAHVKNMQQLEKTMAGGMKVMATDGFQQTISHARLGQMSLRRNIVTVQIDVLKNHAIQSPC